MLTFVLGILCALFSMLAILNGIHPSSLFLVISAVILLPIPRFKKFFEHLSEFNLIPVILSVLVAFCGIAFYPSLSGEKKTDISSSVLIITDLGNNSSAKENTPLSSDTGFDESSSEKPISTSSLNNSSEETITSKEVVTSKETESEEENEVSSAALDIEVLELTSPIGNGQMAMLEIKGEPNTAYSIAVYYGENKSTAKGLEDKVSDKNGKAIWQWRVGARTKAGKHKIIISNKDGNFVTYFTVK